MADCFRQPAAGEAIKTSMPAAHTSLIHTKYLGELTSPLPEKKTSKQIHKKAHATLGYK